MNLTKCNVCEFPTRCKKVDWIQDSSECGSFIEPKSLTVSLLSLLMTDSRKIQDATDLLERFGFRVREIERYPFFRLELVK